MSSEKRLRELYSQLSVEQDSAMVAGILEEILQLMYVQSREKNWSELEGATSATSISNREQRPIVGPGSQDTEGGN